MRACWYCGGNEGDKDARNVDADGNTTWTTMPCHCKGTLEHIHKKCLAEMVAAFRVCRTCGGVLRPEEAPPPAEEPPRAAAQPNELLHLMLNLLQIFVYSTWICRTTAEFVWLWVFVGADADTCVTITLAGRVYHCEHECFLVTT